ncbi:MAG TPA: 2Fe-2S iron-sulfur cluster binding domain-containing protein [Stellaceae bacterium]|nr:2Fe-2S iron-sulfur cluster binding domain-containing protein [Stellaceae bacterium]
MEGYAVTLIFADGRSREIVAGRFETVEQAARRHGIHLLTDCREGACGTCKAKCLRGEFFLNDYSREALSEDEAASGNVLTCQMQVRSPCILEFDYAFAQTGAKSDETWLASVASIDRVSESVVRLVLRGEGEGGRSFLPGQYVNIAIPDKAAARSYSFANEPGPRESIFFVRLIEGGVMGDYLLHRARPGDCLRLNGPFGRFFLRSEKRPLLMIAGGTGLAPMLSILRHLATRGEGPPRILLIYGANRRADLFGLDEIAQLRAKLASLEAIVCVAEGDAEWKGPVGLVGNVAAQQEIDFASFDVYLCGPPPMIEHVQTTLMPRGAKPERIFAERFLPT